MPSRSCARATRQHSLESAHALAGAIEVGGELAALASAATAAVGADYAAGGAGVGLACLLRRVEIALVEPGQGDAPLVVGAQRIEAVADDVAIVIDRQRRGEAPAAVERATETDIAGHRTGQAPRPRDVHDALADEQLGAVLAVAEHRLRSLTPMREASSCSPAARISRAAMGVRVIAECVIAVRVVGVRATLRVCLRHEQDTEQGQQAQLHRRPQSQRL